MNRVMPALVAGIHAGPFETFQIIADERFAWMAGTSPAMTRRDCVCNRSKAAQPYHATLTFRPRFHSMNGAPESRMSSVASDW